MPTCCCDYLGRSLQDVVFCSAFGLLQVDSYAHGNNYRLCFAHISFDCFSVSWYLKGLIRIVFRLPFAGSTFLLDCVRFEIEDARLSVGLS